MIQCIIIDDEEDGRTNLAHLLKAYCPDVEIMGMAESVDSAVEAINELHPQLLFLDIEMKDGTGFDVLRKCTNLQFEVIFVTAHNQYGVDAIKFSAIDYILKPIDDVNLVEAVRKAKVQIELKNENKRLRNLLRNTNQSNPNKRIALPFVDSIEFVEVKNIIRLEADGSYTRFFTIDSNSLLVSGSLREFIEMLSPFGFLRTHQAHLVNPEFIKTLVKSDGGSLLMKNGDSVPISRLRKTDIINKLKGN